MGLIAKRIATLILVTPLVTFGDFGNYNSVILGDRASGMGGASVALPGDSSSASFYNPAMITQSKGNNFSGSANIYNKYDTAYAGASDVKESSLKLNRGAFQAIPAAAGTSLSFGTFAAGISILTPDFNLFSGDIPRQNLAGGSNSTNSSTFINYKDQSLWVGGNLAINYTDDMAFGLTFYYTSRDFFRATTDQTISNNRTQFVFESKAFTSNNILYILGGLKRWGRFGFGMSYRLPSIQLSGDGSYYKSVLDTDAGNTPVTNSISTIAAQTEIPYKLSTGLSYTIPKFFAVTGQVDIYGPLSFRDFEHPTAGEQVTYRQIMNYSVGAEIYARSWLALRAGAFTNFSSHPEITDNAERQGDHIDMLGFSSNLTIFSQNTTFTFGGYFTGGKGQSTELVGNRIAVIPKNTYIFSMLVSTSYYF